MNRHPSPEVLNNTSSIVHCNVTVLFCPLQVFDTFFLVLSLHALLSSAVLFKTS